MILAMQVFVDNQLSNLTQFNSTKPLYQIIQLTKFGFKGGAIVFHKNVLMDKTNTSIEIYYWTKQI